MLPAPGRALFPFNGVMWSIFFELFINVVWAIFWRPLQSTRTLVLVIASCGIGLGISCAYLDTFTGLGTGWGSFVGGAFRVGYSFFLGVLFFRIHKVRKLAKLPPLFLLICLPAILFLPLPVYIELAVAMFVLPWFVLLGSQVEPTGIVEFIARQLGLASYGVYAVHKRLYGLSYGLLLVLGLDLHSFAPWVGIAFALALVIGCLIVNRVYDQPARRWLSDRFRTPRRLIAREDATQAP
jgi:peptidoglycan/LPS O-acetylase OafA/YrhL